MNNKGSTEAGLPGSVDFSAGFLQALSPVADQARLSSEQKLEWREKFFTLVSHDLRSPLTAAKLSAELILRKPQDAPVLAGRILEALVRAEGMIRSFLDANRLQSGQGISFSPEPCDLHTLVAKACEEQSFLHQRSCVYEGTSPVLGRWDSRTLRRALDNLLSNAFKYGDPHHPVSVHLGQCAEEVRFSVHNFGEPIPPEELPSLFRWHSRTVAAEKSGQAGWGLGLMLVRAMAEAHGGRVEVQSSATAGTTFSLILPRESPARLGPTT